LDRIAAWPQTSIGAGLGFGEAGHGAKRSLRGGKPSHELLATQQAARRTLTASFT
jgi:hypothetical protein